MTVRDALAGTPPGTGLGLRHPKRTWLLIALPVLAFGLACALQVLHFAADRPGTTFPPLSEYFPPAISGWIGEDRPLGETEAVSKRVRNLLNYDDAFQRIYRKQGREFGVYVAYWHADKVPARDVSFHVPDVCWVGVGWKRTAADFYYRLNLNGRRLAPAQYREFDAPGDHQHVVFWHIVDGHAVFFSPDGPPSQLTMIKAIFRHGYRQRGEQYFIRISSQTSLADLWQDDGFQAIMELIAPLGPGLSPELDQY